jgi:glycosyltransferase involved in cell wall biosynthesis
MSHVSCIIPYYNGSDTIASAIDSVITSPYCLEVVVVVDASPQPLEPALTERQRQLIDAGQLRIVHLAGNYGQACARNLGASMSVGPYLSFLDQDDVYFPAFYERGVPFMEANPQFAAIEVGAELVQDGHPALDDHDPRYAQAIHSAPWNVLVRRNAFWCCGGFPVGAEFRTALAGEDVVFKNALKQCFLVGHAADKLIRHHIREGSATDRYLKRTEVVNGEVVFRSIHEREADGSWERAANLHLRRAWDALQAQRAVAPAPATSGA